MNKEEKQAIEVLKKLKFTLHNHHLGGQTEIDTILNLIEKQQKEIEELHKERNELVNPSNLRFSYFDNKSQTQVVINGFVSKDKIREDIKRFEKLQEQTQAVLQNIRYTRADLIKYLKELVGDE